MTNLNHPNLRLLIDKVDQLSNASTVAESLLKEDAILIEGLMDILSRTAGNALKAPITTVTSTAQGAAVIAKALSNPTYLDTLTFLLKKYIKNAMKQITAPKVVEYINRVFPRGRTLKDFLKALFLVPIVNLVKVSLAATQDQLTDNLKNYLATEVLNLDRYVTTFISQGFGAITGILGALKLTNIALFDILNMLNVKMRTIQPTTPPAGGPPPSLAESRSSSVVYKFKMSNYTPIV